MLQIIKASLSEWNLETNVDVIMFLCKSEIEDEEDHCNAWD